MNKEVQNFIKVWISAIMSISYCYYIPTRIKPGFLRLFSVLPIICALFLLLLLFHQSTPHLSFITFYFLSGLATSKLYLFAFDKGPLLPFPPNLPQFICLTCFPITLQQNPNPNPKNQNQNHSPKWLFPIKVSIFAVLLHVYLYDYKQIFPQVLLFGLYALQLYLEHEILSIFVKVLVFISTGCNVEPQFIEPYLATSLQDFWGRRWNLTVSAILQETVYIPVRRICNGRIRADWCRILGVLAVFFVSGVAHELFIYSLTLEMPRGEVILFFLLHGICTTVEVMVKRTGFGRRIVVRAAVSRILTVGFVVMSGGFLFFPPFIRSNVMEKRAKETLFFFDYLKRCVFKLFLVIFAN